MNASPRIHDINGSLDPDGFPLSRIRSVTGYRSKNADSDFLTCNALGENGRMKSQRERQNGDP
jgi:hypothetical protein